VPSAPINDPPWHTIMLRLYYYDLQGEIGKNKVLAALMIASTPPLLLFVLFQKRIMQGIAMTGVKF
jgi:ABC-type glycerol-3-phosphate transport system permease component